MGIVAGLLLACQMLARDGVGTHAALPGPAIVCLGCDIEEGLLNLGVNFYFPGRTYFRVDGDGTRARPLRIRWPICYGFVALEIKMIFPKTAPELQLPEGVPPLLPGGVPFRPGGGRGP
jgi:hypothetical protein